MSQFDLLIESLKRSKEHLPNGCADVWSLLAAGDESQLAIKEISREETTSSLIVNIRCIDGNEYEVTITKARKWL